MRAASVVVPAKPLQWAKTRTSLPPRLRRELAVNLLEHTVSAALGAKRVGMVLVVTADPTLAGVARRLGARVEPEPGMQGLNHAARLGRRRAAELRPGGAVSVLVGDLPLLDPAEVDDVIGQLSASPRPLIVVDRHGRGTTFLAHPPGVLPPTRFGPDSAQAHIRAGFLCAHGVLTGLRHDLDTISDLDFALSARSASAAAPWLARFSPRPGRQPLHPQPDLDAHDTGNGAPSRVYLQALVCKCDSGHMPSA